MEKRECTLIFIDYLMNKFIKFLFVGIINTILCLLFFLFFTKFLILNIFISNFLSYIFIIPLSYILYKFYVFQTPGSIVNKTNYVIAFIAAYLMNYLLLVILSSFTGLANELIHFLGMSVYTVVFYFINKNFIFNRRA